jgi:F-type H+-transporting ATPase subunit gamma
LPNARETRNRIKGVESTRQITRAMQLVATSKMNRAQDAVRATRPYADKIGEVLRHLAHALPSEDGLHPLFEARRERNVALVVLSTNRGLCGALNTNVARRALEFAEEAGAGEEESEISMVGVGKVGIRMLGGSLPVVASFLEVPDRPRITDVTPIARLMVDGFESREFDAVHVVYPEFVNTLTQRPEHVQLLPVKRPEALEAGERRPDYIYEPNAETVLHMLLPRYVEMYLYRLVLETTASEQSARMVAMRNATENASDLIDELTLSYNRQRQASITNEMIDIAAGANALAQ